MLLTVPRIILHKTVTREAFPVPFSFIISESMWQLFVSKNAVKGNWTIPLWNRVKRRAFSLPLHQASIFFFFFSSSFFRFTVLEIEARTRVPWTMGSILRARRERHTFSLWRRDKSQEERPGMCLFSLCTIYRHRKDGFLSRRAVYGGSWLTSQGPANLPNTSTGDVELKRAFPWA